MKRLLWLSLVFLATPAWALQTDALQWSITPYIWASNTKVDLSYGGSELGGDKITFGDLLDTLDSAFMLNVEVGKGHWSYFGDLTYLETSETEQRTLFTVDTASEHRVLDAGVAYWPGGAGSNLSLIGGARYTDFDDRYTFRLGNEPVATARNSKDYLDALLGIRYRFDFGERWGLLTHADYSFGDSEGTYMLQAIFSYIVGQRRQNRIIFGYQYKQAEFEDGDLTLDFSYRGPMAGFSFRF